MCVLLFLKSLIDARSEGKKDIIKMMQLVTTRKDKRRRKKRSTNKKKANREHKTTLRKKLSGKGAGNKAINIIGKTLIKGAIIPRLLMKLTGQLRKERRNRKRLIWRK